MIIKNNFSTLDRLIKPPPFPKKIFLNKGGGVYLTPKFFFGGFAPEPPFVYMLCLVLYYDSDTVAYLYILIISHGVYPT